MEELPTRELIITSSADEMDRVFTGMTIRLNAEMVNFLEDDSYVIQWKYSVDGEEFIDIEGANDLEYSFVVNRENAKNIWRISIILITDEE